MQKTLEKLDRGVARIADGAPWLSCLVLVVLMLAVLLPMQATIPPIDRDEVLFAQASRQMAESGDWIDIRFAKVRGTKNRSGSTGCRQRRRTSLAVTIWGGCGFTDCRRFWPRLGQCSVLIWLA